MMFRILWWIDQVVFRCRWNWLCDYVWDREMARDIESGAFGIDD